MLPRMLRVGMIAAVVAALGAACGVPARNGGGGGGGDDDQPHDARTSGGDGKASDAPATPDAAIDAPVGGGLDPDLELPPGTGTPCTHPGAIGGECGQLEVCRYFTPTEGRCETCTDCGNLNAACTATNQCDILFECYQHKCTNFCTLGTTECGAPADCINIGSATRGVCRP